MKFNAEHKTRNREVPDEQAFKELACKLIKDMPFKEFKKLFNCSKKEDEYDQSITKRTVFNIQIEIK